MSRHIEVDELLGAYALGAVSEQEATTVREHVAGCLECSSNLQRLAAVASVLPLAVEPVEPPASLRRRVMAEVNGEVGAETLGNVLELPPAWRRPKVARRLPGLRPREIWRHGRRWVPGAVAAVVIAGLLSWNVILQRQLSSPGIAPAAGVATGSLTDARSTRVGTVTYLPQSRVAVVSLHSLRKPSVGRAYEMWLIPSGGHPQPAGLFTPEADGSKLLLVPHPIGPRDTIAVTEEPLGGSDGPTSVPFITGHI
jgi:anti-sigma-K factor RskA